MSSTLSLLNDSSIQKSESFYLICSFIGTIGIGFSTFHIKNLIIHFKNFDQMEFYSMKMLIYALISAYMMKIKRMTFSNCFDNSKNNFWLLLRNSLSLTHNLCKIKTLEYMRMTTSNIFTSLFPIFTCWLSVIFLKEQLTKRNIIGLFICFTGAYLLIQNDNGGSEENYDIMRVLIGTFFGLSHTITLASMIVSNKFLLNSGFTVELILFLIGFTSLIFSILIKILIGSNLTENFFKIEFILNVLLNGVVGFFSDFLIQYCQKNVNIVKSIGISYFIIVQSFILDYFFFNEKITFLDILGSSMIIGFNFYCIIFPEKN